MMIDIENLWEKMGENQKRLLHTKTSKEIYISNITGKFAFSLFLNSPDFKLNPKLKLSGLTIKKFKNEIHIILADNANWKLFLLIGVDLIDSIDRIFPADNALIQQLEHRIYEWQQILKNRSTKDIPLTIQMGLFAELKLLIESFNDGYAIDNIINCWSGPDKGKQDFNFENILVEVKSYKTEKGPFITITSEHQLYNTDKPIFLVTYALSIMNNGDTIKSLADLILSKLNRPYTKNIFLKKLYEYGYEYFHNYSDLYSFIIDDRCCYKVSNLFPKITSEILAKGILKVRYRIDLSKCAPFLIEKLPDYHANN